MLGRLLRLKSKIYKTTIGRHLAPKTSFAPRSGELEASKSKTNVFMWHADRLCAQKVDNTSKSLCKLGVKAITIYKKPPQTLQKWQPPQPHTYKIAKQGFDVPLVKIIKNKWVVIVAKVLLCLAVLYLAIIVTISTGIVAIIVALIEMKR